MTSNEIGNRQIAARIVRGSLQGVARRRSELRFGLLRDVWASTKRFSAGDAIRNLDIRELPAVRDAVVHGYIDDRNRAVLAALCQGFGAKTFFEIGTNRGRTAWTVAKNNPELEVYTLDLPDPGAAQQADLELIEADKRVFENWRRAEAVHGTPEADRIHELLGDSATFDYGPYEGKMDVVFIDGSHSYQYVRSDTEAALKLLTPGGAILWDDYPGFPGIYQALLESEQELDAPIYHILGTRLALYSRTPLQLEALDEDEHRSVSFA